MPPQRLSTWDLLPPELQSDWRKARSSTPISLGSHLCRRVSARGQWAVCADVQAGGRGRVTSPGHSDDRQARGTARRVVTHVGPTCWAAGSWHGVTIWPFSELKLSANLMWWSDLQQLTGLSLLPHKRGATEIMSGPRGAKRTGGHHLRMSAPVLGTLQDPRH